MYWHVSFLALVRKLSEFAVPEHQVNFQTSTTLRKLLVHVQQETPMEKKKGVVYSIPCMDSNSVYVGETGWNLEKGLKEHLYAVKRMDEKNGISVHAWKNHTE